MNSKHNESVPWAKTPSFNSATGTNILMATPEIASGVQRSSNLGGINGNIFTHWTH